MFVDDRVRDIDQIRAICLYNIEFVVELVYLQMIEFVIEFVI